MHKASSRHMGITFIFLRGNSRMGNGFKKKKKKNNNYEKKNACRNSRVTLDGCVMIVSTFHPMSCVLS